MRNEIARLHEREARLMDQLDASAALVQGLKESKQSLQKDLKYEKRGAEQRVMDEEKMKILEERNEVLEKQVKAYPWHYIHHNFTKYYNMC